MKTNLRGAVLTAVSALGCVLLVPAESAAYSRTRHNGLLLHWKTAGVTMTPAAVSTPDLTDAAVDDAIAQSVAPWSSETLACTYMTVNVADRNPSSLQISNSDQRNVIVFREGDDEDDWCSPFPDEVAKDGCYDPSALAITRVWFYQAGSKEEGRIVDTDIEINAVNFTWGILTPGEEPVASESTHDLINTLTHEMGHVLGFDHNCFVPRGATMDHQGNALPSCSNASDNIRAATMFASASAGETEKRTLEADDIQAMCDTFPLAQKPADRRFDGTPQPPDSDGCSMGAGASPPTTGVGAFFVFTLWAAVRGRRRKTSNERASR